MTKEKIKNTQVIIIGAGPGGCTAALQLHKMNIPCTLIDKAVFPREKVCGDALSGKVTTILHRINPDYLKEFNQQKFKKNIWGIRMFAPNRVHFDIPFKWKYDVSRDSAPGAVASRFNTDNFLVKLVKDCDSVDFMEGVEITNIRKVDDGFIIKDKKEELELKTGMLLIANGANSKFSRELAGIKKEDKHFAGAVRAYFDNVSGFHEHGFIELHFLKEYIPGYFWVFPMPGNRANVGLGLRTDHVSKRSLNLRKELFYIVENYPGVKERFENASLVGKVSGHSLPLGSKYLKRSGDHFMLLGDAAHLIDPITGEGVGNAMYSGWIAGEQVARCFETGRFDQEEMINYDKRIQRVVGVELKLSFKLQRLVKHQWLINSFAKRLDKNENIRKLFTRMYTDLELRKKLSRPGFWWKLLTRRI